ncbi:ACT domain-containing protein [Herpetosiphon geysericola]|uniref:Amino acid-binding protein n=1 Tax=Herpetosiphon geysericola TaxID=70996 RepID=A0A0P6YHE5_9CHLR|nr:ACT domain-containing protein [Herpetosiphon geysericola]KPL88893.1 amino acid-binding protein [Herpetosiphon geysericola]
MHQLSLINYPEVLAVARLEVDQPWPEWAMQSPFVSISRTSDELSIVCERQFVPATVQAERNWRGLRVAGSLDFSQVGILASLAAPLAQAQISIFVLSTYDTDYLLLREHEFGEAVAVLTAAGHTIS